MRLRTLLLATFAFVGCATSPPRITERDALAAANNLMAPMPWVAQATFTAQKKYAEWAVIVSCNACKNPDGTPVSAEYVIRVERNGRASILVGLNNGAAVHGQGL